jgi:6-pyruvoyltetrahydropterin/6-carboxytetrahydropterin synthase
MEFPSSEYLCQHIHSDLLERFSFPLKVKVWEGEGKWCEKDNFSK